jgi:hypothetical protein
LECYENQELDQNVKSAPFLNERQLVGVIEVWENYGVFIACFVTKVCMNPICYLEPKVNISLDPLFLHQLSTSQQIPSKTSQEFTLPNCAQHGIVALCKEAPLRRYTEPSNREWSHESHHV